MLSGVAIKAWEAAAMATPNTISCVKEYDSQCAFCIKDKCFKEQLIFSWFGSSLPVHKRKWPLE